ncbi:hypothetical protein QBC35DRAFT_280899 [Podospora australis]|uniref:Uncharacterized protein n=1 Tax=Podospora australis TaxID=1536484 RepID=A0AAN6X227_9PEZI|nr:hypothetical protein QBC35DRAFT_280899 [Podospora australis]
MDDAIRPNAETFRHYYAQGYMTWQRLCLKAVAYHEFPAHLVDLEHACPKVPYLHNRLELKPGYHFHATGTSTWQAGNGDSGCDLPPFQRTYSIPVTARHPICRLCRALARAPNCFRHGLVASATTSVY